MFVELRGFRLTLALSALIGLASGCEPEPPPQLQTDVEAVDDPPVSVPASFPREFPSYPGSSPVEAYTGEEGAALVRYRVDARPGQILGYMKAELEIAGWQIEGVGEEQDEATLLAIKGPLSATVIIQETEGGGSSMDVSVLPLAWPSGLSPSE